jgi:hypothetical protein
MELFKVISNAVSGVYLDGNNNRVDLITAEVKFYCPVVCNKVCGELDTCCKRFETEEEAVIHFNLTKYVV